MNEFEKYTAEAKSRWGETGAYKEYEEKTKHYSKEKWLESAEGLNSLFYEFALCLKEGENASSAKVQILVSQLQNHISENYYTCTKEILLGLGQMYVFDERFKNNIDKNGEGTAQFVSDAIKIYCE